MAPISKGSSRKARFMVSSATFVIRSCHHLTGTLLSILSTMFRTKTWYWSSHYLTSLNLIAPESLVWTLYQRSLLSSLYSKTDLKVLIHLSLHIDFPIWTWSIRTHSLTLAPQSSLIVASKGISWIPQIFLWCVITRLNWANLARLTSRKV